MTMRTLFVLGLAAATLATARADVKPHPLFTDHMVLQRDQEIRVWGTAAAEEEVAVSLEGPAKADATCKADKDGHWKATLPAQKAGTGFTLTLKGKSSVTLKNVAVGDVWICSGQSNMQWEFAQPNTDAEGKKVPSEAKNANIRLFTMPRVPSDKPQSEFKPVKMMRGKDAVREFGVWQEVSPATVLEFSQVAYFFGLEIERSQKVPVGLLATNWGGTPAEAWTSEEKLSQVDDLKYYLDKKKNAKGINQSTPTALFNGMIAPLLPFKIKGAIWYQGESNASRAYEYRTLMPALIEDWRKHWGSDFPFLMVQLAPFRGGASGVDYAELRDAQWHTAKKLKGVGLAVITDAGHETDIHPMPKKPVGERLALAARAIAYGETIEYSGPQYKAVKIEGDKAILSFDHIGKGLDVKGEALTGFTVCGEDKVFHPAKAEIKGDVIVVSCDQVAKPVAVRYGWVNFAKPTLNFFNKDGLPAVPFRTDDFPLTTMPKK